MAVTVENAVERIKRNIGTPLFVNANNTEDYSAVRNRLLTVNTFKLSLYFQQSILLPDAEKMISDVKLSDKPTLVLGLMEYLAFKDETMLRQTISEIGRLNKRIIVLCSHLETVLNNAIQSDIRFKDRVVFLNGNRGICPGLTLSAFKIKYAHSYNTLKDCVEDIEENGCKTSMVVSNLNQKVFENSLWSVKTIDSAYDALCFQDSSIADNFSKDFGTESQWLLLYNELSSITTSVAICRHNFGVAQPEDVIENYTNYTEDKKWLLLYLLKSSTQNNYVVSSAKNANTTNEFIPQLYSHILNFDKNEKSFGRTYSERRRIIEKLADDSEMFKFINLADIKREDKIYYLTDLTEAEKKEFIKCIIGYDYSNTELIAVLQKNYPKLADYLSEYYFGIDFWTDIATDSQTEAKHDLGEYFELYKIQKLKNMIDESFIVLVNRFATETPRQFIVKLPTRSMVLAKEASVDNVYFLDALGCEFLGYISKRCDVLGLKADIEIARAEMPTITGLNDGFFDESRGDKKIKDLDKLKHSGIGDYDYSKTKLPLYIVDELEIIENVLKAIKAEITRIQKPAMIISDHGASRLVRIYDRAITVDAEVDGKHGGRCCVWKDGLNEVSPFASDNENGYCVLANYDRFAGGKYTGVELHGGATLEEVVVPIIKLSLKNKTVTAKFNSIKIKVKRGKAEPIVVTLSENVDRLRLKIGDKFYMPALINPTTYAFSTDVKKPEKVTAKLLDDNQVIQDNIIIEFVSAIGGTDDIL
jgi:hypothetical protein